MACTAVAPHVGATGIAQGGRQAACVSIHAPTCGSDDLLMVAGVHQVSLAYRHPL